MMSDHPDIFEGNPDVDRVVPDNWRVEKYCSFFNRTPRVLSYGNWIGDPDRINPPKVHIINEIMVRSGLTGEVSLRPWFPLIQTSEDQKRSSSLVCIQGSGTQSSTEMKNKQWDATRYFRLAVLLKEKYQLVQLGMPGESVIPGAKDLRGKLSVRQTAETLANCRFYIGQVGFLMHLARAVSTRSVIIYGGREKSWLSGYPCNENLETSPPCSPCWQNNRCDYNRMCLDSITEMDVLDAVQRLENRLNLPIETEMAILP